jgi:hypothetical protein
VDHDDGFRCSSQARLFLAKGESKVVCKEHFQSLRPLFGPQALPWQIAFDDKWFILEIYQDRIILLHVPKTRHALLSCPSPHHTPP